MAGISEHAAKASAKRKEISSELDALDELQDKVAASQARLVGLKSEMSEIESAAATAGFPVADLHAEAYKVDEPGEDEPAKAPVRRKPKAKASK